MSVYGCDPISTAGVKAQLMNHPAVELLGPADLGRARVAVVVSDVADEPTAKVVRAVQRERRTDVVLVASRFEKAGVVSAVASGTTAFLRKGDATAARLVEKIREVEEAGCQLPASLLKKAASTTTPRAGEQEPGPVPWVDRPGEGRATLTAARLSARESAVMRLVAEGFDTSAIAEQLAYSESTIKSALTKVMTRLEARNRCHAVAIAIRDGLI